MYIENSYLKKQFSIWLLLMLLIISIIIIVGGLTRLTDSGLSITEWELFSGFLPPFNESDWDNNESISWKQPTTYDQSEMLSSFFNMENSYPWLGFSDKIEYEAYNNLED